MIDPLNAHIGGKIQSKRLELGFGQDDFATLTGIDSDLLSNAEKGTERLSPQQVAAICKLLDIQVAWLYQDAPLHELVRKLPSFPYVDYLGNRPDRQLLTDNFDRLPPEQQRELVNRSAELLTAMVAKAKKCR
jgi:transcriptional regulator with XRE-family HTH domain